MTKEAGIDKITGLYAALLISVALIPVPHMVVGVMGGAVFLSLVLYAYMISMDAEPGGAAYVHARYIIRTFWLSFIFLFLGLLLAVAGIGAAMVLGYMSMESLYACSGGDLSPCMKNFISDNQQSFSAASFVALGPAILYLLFRFARGLIRVRELKSFIL